MTATWPCPGRSSSAVNGRPAFGATPITGKKSAVTRAATSFIGSPAPVRLYSRSNAIAAMRSNDRLRAFHSGNSCAPTMLRGFSALRRSHTITSRSGLAKGNGLRRTALTMLKTAVVLPMLSVIRMTTNAREQRRARDRPPRLPDVVPELAHGMSSMTRQGSARAPRSAGDRRGWRARTRPLPRSCDPRPPRVRRTAPASPPRTARGTRADRDGAGAGRTTIAVHDVLQVRAASRRPAPRRAPRSRAPGRGAPSAVMR